MAANRKRDGWQVKDAGDERVAQCPAIEIEEGSVLAEHGGARRQDGHCWHHHRIDMLKAMVKLVPERGDAVLAAI